MATNTYNNRLRAAQKVGAYLDGARGVVPSEAGASLAGDVLEVDVTVTAGVLLEYGGPTTRILYHFNQWGELRNAELTTTDNPDGEFVSIDLDGDEAEELADAYTFGLDVLADTALSALHRNWPGAFDTALG